MSMNRRKLFAALALGLLLSLVAGAAFAAETMDELRVRFPDGMYWNHAGMATDNSDGCTDTPCPIHTGANGTEYYTTCNIFKEGSEATRSYGFARRVAFGLFDSVPTLGQWETRDGAQSGGWTQATRIGSLSELSQGDLLQFRAGSPNEAAIVYEVGADSVTLLEADLDHHCRISWTRTLTLAQLNAQLQHVWRHPAPANGVIDEGGATYTSAGAYSSLAVSNFTTTLSTSGVLRMTAQWQGGVAPYQVNISLYNERTGVRVNDYNISTRAVYATNAVSSLPAGSYRAMVVVQDAMGYAASASRRSIEISGGQPAQTLRVDNVSLSAQEIQTGMTVTARMTVSGGVAPYTYAYDVRTYTASAKQSGAMSFNAGAQQTYRFDAAGTFIIRAYVKDARGSVASLDSGYITVTRPVASLVVRNVSLNRTSVTAPGSVTATVNVSGGTPPYTYALEIIRTSDGAVVDSVYYRSGSQISYTFYNAGSYRIRGLVRDAQGYEAEGRSATISVHSDPLALTSAKVAAARVNTASNISLKLTAKGGALDYEYGAVVYYAGTNTIYKRVNYQSSSNVKFKISDPGVYTLRGRVRDANGTEAYRYADTDVTVIYRQMEITGVSLAATGINVGASSKVTIEVAYGTPNYQYGLRIYDENGGLYKTVKYGSSQAVKYSIGDKGVYRIEAMVRDAAGQEVTQYASKKVTVSQPLKASGPAVTSINSHPGMDWTMKSSASGGTPPYTYNYTILKVVDNDKRTEIDSFSTNKKTYTYPCPDELGEYTVYLTVTDAAGKTTSRNTSSSLFLFKELKAGSMKINKDSLGIKENIKLTVSASGGYRKLKFRFGVQKLNESTGKYKTFNSTAWTTDKTFTYRTTEKGTFRFACDVKDERDSALTMHSDPFTVR